MKKFRFILALLFLTEAIVGIFHIVIGVFLKETYPLIMYIIMPLAILACVLITFILSPILDWIMRD
jgi:hypothetical protein